MAEAIVFLDARVPEWLQASKLASNQLAADGFCVTLVDVSQYAWPRFTSISFGASRRVLGHSVVSLRKGSFRARRRPALHRGHLKEEALLSSRLSALRDIGGGLLARRTDKLLADRSHAMLNALCAADSPVSERPGVFVIPNGRFSHQRALLELISEKFPASKCLFLEIIEEHVFLEPFPPHSRKRLQNKINATSIDVHSLEHVADAWLAERRRPESSSNKFSKRWTALGTSESLNLSRNLFLSSSTDEYWALGPDWHEAKWVDQYEAFDVVLQQLESDGDFQSTLRVHPNLLNKSIRFIKGETQRIKWLQDRHPTLRVIGPRESVNTYELIDAAERIFVSISTAGLEASAQGKPVWCVMSTNYDLVADVRSLHKRADVNSHVLAPWKVDPMRAKKFIAWNQSLPPLERLSAGLKESSSIDGAVQNWLGLGSFYLGLLALRKFRLLIVAFTRNAGLK